MLSYVLLAVLFLVPSPALPTAQVQPTVLAPVWSSPLGTLRDTHIVAAGRVGDLLLVQDGRHGVTALSPATGEPVWFVQLPSALDHWPSPGERALVLSAGTSQLVVDTRTGSRLHTHRGASVAAHAPASDGRLLFVPSLLGDAVVVIDLATGLQAWRMSMEHPFATPALVVGSDARRSVVVGTQDGMLRALPATLDVPRTERWATRVGRPIGAPVLHADRLFVASEQRALWALSPSGGDAQWKHLPGEALASGPVVLGSAVCVATTTRLLGLAPADGRLVWEVEGAFTPLGEVAGQLLVRTGAGACELRDPSDGALKLGGLPPDLQAAGPVALAIEDGVRIVAWGRP
ncbi:MAG: outer membrane protein assembly factor BamB family protein [Planctomycetota bacterium]|jgi:outer membrane protein assembly factor BamB